MVGILSIANLELSLEVLFVDMLDAGERGDPLIKGFFFAYQTCP